MKALADKHNVKYATLRSRKSREKWGEEVATQQKKRCNKKKSVATQQAIEQLEHNDELNDKQKQFCLLYLKYFNATKAYQEAYGVDYNTAHSIGYRLLANDGIKKELERLKKAQQQDLYVDSLDIKKEWLKQSFADITDFTEFGNEEYTVTDEATGEKETRIGSFLRLKNDDEVDGTLIQEIKQGRDGVSLKLHDKQKAMDKLMEFLTEADGTQEDKIIIVNNLQDERMKKWVDENGGL